MLSALRHAPDRWLHAVRRRRALNDVRALAGGGTLLVVCHGNICRSPYAAALLRRALLDSGIAVESAGFVGPGRPVPPFAATTARRRGADLSAHRSRLLDADLVGAAQVIVVMDTAQRARVRREWPSAGRILLLGDLDPLPIAKRAIRDPYDQSPAVFEEVFVRIDRCAEALARRIGGDAPRARLSDPRPPAGAAASDAPGP